MNIVFVEPLGICECKFNAAVANLKKQGHEVIFYPDRQENEDILIERAKDADIVVTGEGRLDHQTAMGKAPVGVAKLAKKYDAKVIAFAGSVAPEATACNQAGIDAFFPIVRGITTLKEAMDPDCAKANMQAAVEQVFRLL